MKGEGGVRCIASMELVEEEDSLNGPEHAEKRMGNWVLQHQENDKSLSIAICDKLDMNYGYIKVQSTKLKPIYFVLFEKLCYVPTQGKDLLPLSESKTSLSISAYPSLNILFFHQPQSN
ncbi:unnamed protein product [Sphenostylis stenocarpa]|uniref:Uncharacterized protein n=1 Tax=Sphenostylis stenocarpa TaxID=92480 RepID=A0AA86SJL6_9FABA|nr:unnamed protein product [Sphenostylis stenocarpa]